MWIWPLYLHVNQKSDDDESDDDDDTLVSGYPISYFESLQILTFSGYPIRSVFQFLDIFSIHFEFLISVYLFMILHFCLSIIFSILHDFVASKTLFMDILDQKYGNNK